MKKQPSVVAIVIAVIMSIVLFPLIFGTGIASGAVFSAESMMQEGREWELYDAFTEHGGEDWVYELLLSETGETIEIEQEVSVSIRELFPKEDVSTLMKELYEALIKGERYSVELPNQKLFVEQKLMEYFDDTVEKEMKEQFGDAYELLDEQAKDEEA